MDPIVLYTICSAYRLPFPEDTIKMIRIPSQTFGFFITIHRSQPLSKWPHDIHGCIGYWEDKRMSKEAIIGKIPGIANSSFFTDSRVQYHAVPLLEDPDARIEISFMQLPLTPISANRKTFDNEKYGLIVESDQGRATYLPKVFKTKNWGEISASLLRKAQVKTGKFFQYETSVVEGKLRTIFDREYLDWVAQEYLIFMEINYGNFVPYMVENGRVVTDKMENVRNCATLCELLDFPVSKNLRAKIRRDIKYYIAKSKNSNMGNSLISHSEINECRHYKFAKRIYTEQANAFLIMAMAKIEGKVSQTLVDICDDLYKNLDGMDAQFQLGETLIGLHRVCPRIKELAHWQKFMEKRLEGLDGRVENIFEYNWQAKYLFEIRKDIPAKAHAEELLRRLLGMKITGDMETNYLAVYFEAMMSLWGILGGEEISRIILPVWIFLLQRWKNGVYKTQEIKNSSSFYLFYFKNGTARIDITGHIINGLKVYTLMENN
jgi:AMMECR1 domain-containing protein